MCSRLVYHHVTLPPHYVRKHILSDVISTAGCEVMGYRSGAQRRPSWAESSLRPRRPAGGHGPNRGADGEDLLGRTFLPDPENPDPHMGFSACGGTQNGTNRLHNKGLGPKFPSRAHCDPVAVAIYTCFAPYRSPLNSPGHCAGDFFRKVPPMATTPALDKPYKPTNTELKANKSQNQGKLPMPKARPLPGRGNKNG